MNMKSFLKAGLFLSVMMTPAIAHASVLVVRGLTSGRLWALLPGVIALISIIIGGLALRFSARIEFKKRGGITALVGGAVCIILSIVHLARATGGFGTGSGKLGAIVALVLGITAMILGGMALSRYRKIADSNSKNNDRNI
jgi:FtsH-binding integral membrane protein